VGVALIAIVAIGGIYAVWPLRDLGLSSIGWWMIGGAAILGAIEIGIVLRMIKQSEPISLDVTKKFLLSKLDQSPKDLAYSCKAFKDDDRDFVAYLVKEGSHKELLIYLDNKLQNKFLASINEHYLWISDGAKP